MMNDGMGYQNANSGGPLGSSWNMKNNEKVNASELLLS